MTHTGAGREGESKKMSDPEPPQSVGGNQGEMDASPCLGPDTEDTEGGGGGGAGRAEAGMDVDPSAAADVSPAVLRAV